MSIVAQPPDGAPPDAEPVRRCDHWVGAEAAFCQSGDSVRQFVTGYRCPLHTPSAIQGRPEPQPGPGWPIHREMQRTAQVAVQDDEL